MRTPLMAPMCRVVCLGCTWRNEYHFATDKPRNLGLAKTNTNGNTVLITGINIAIVVVGTVLLTVTAEGTRTPECTKVFKEWCGIA